MISKITCKYLPDCLVLQLFRLTGHNLGPPLRYNIEQLRQISSGPKTAQARASCAISYTDLLIIPILQV